MYEACDGSSGFLPVPDDFMETGSYSSQLNLPAVARESPHECDADRFVKTHKRFLRVEDDVPRRGERQSPRTIRMSGSGAAPLRARYARVAGRAAAAAEEHVPLVRTERRGDERKYHMLIGLHRRHRIARVECSEHILNVLLAKFLVRGDKADALGGREREVESNAGGIARGGDSVDDLVKAPHSRQADRRVPRVEHHHH
mmetsp:Transcript_14384/g.33559  ORF Transcript_14384/g.33559 Transcript_14384/m.33559 type:complete len:200 (-) Transcript_14384:1939-2538(-)